VSFINMQEITARGLNMADLARLSGVSYNRIWREATGGLAKGLERSERERLERVLEEKRPAAAQS
jgi:hypothetical protein